MSNLVTRLRQRLGDAWRLNDEAADEIERLRTALQRIVVENADIHCEEIALAALEDDDE